MSTDPEKTSHKQRGFTLLIGLILLIAISLVVIGTATTSFFQEKMAGAEITIHRDFEEAERRIREKEAALAAGGAAGLSANENFSYRPCGIVNVTSDNDDGTRVGGVTIKTTFYVPPIDEAKYWTYGTPGKQIICHVSPIVSAWDWSVGGPPATYPFREEALNESAPGDENTDDANEAKYWLLQRRRAIPEFNPNVSEDCSSGNTIVVSDQAWLGDGETPTLHQQHACDYGGECKDGATWSCRERFGNVPRRLSWTQVWD